MTMPTIIR